MRRSDQDKINRFSRLHRKETGVEDDLKAKQVSSTNAPPTHMPWYAQAPQKDKEDLEEIANELELADEDEKVPYKIGDCFLSLPVAEVQELLAGSVARIDEEVAALEERLQGLRDEMEGLKVALYARFGKTINLES